MGRCILKATNPYHDYCYHIVGTPKRKWTGMLANASNNDTWRLKQQDCWELVNAETLCLGKGKNPHTGVSQAYPAGLWDI